MKKKRTSKKNLIKQFQTKANNYGLVVFLFIILIITVVVYTNNKDEVAEFEPLYNEIDSNVLTEIEEETEEIRKLREYTEGGDINTFKIYQSMYTNESVKLKTLNTEDILHIAYKYIEKTQDLGKHYKFITCDIANKVGLSQNIYQCGGNKYNISTFQYTTYITKDLLKKTAIELFNININEFTNFYTNEDNLCYFIDNEFICVTKKLKETNPIYQKEFIRAYTYENKIEIIEEYYFIKNNKKHKYFNAKEEGSGLFISTFEKTNGKYHWTETKPFEN